MLKKTQVLLLTALTILTPAASKAQTIEERIDSLEKRVAVIENSLEQLTELTKKVAFKVKDNSQKQKDLVLILKSMQKENRRLALELERLKEIQVAEKSKNPKTKSRRERKKTSTTSSEITLAQIRAGNKNIIIAKRGLKKYILATVTNVTPDRTEKIWRAIQDIRRFGIPVYGYVNSSGFLVLTTRTEPQKIEKLKRYLPYRPVIARKQNTGLGTALTSRQILSSLINLAAEGV